MKKFATPLAIEGTKEQLEALVPKLEALGYQMKNKYRDGAGHKFLITPYARLEGCIGYNQDANGDMIISASIPDLVLALAAMVADNNPHDEEYWQYRGNELDDYFDKDKIFKIITWDAGQRVYHDGQNSKIKKGDWSNIKWFTGDDDINQQFFKLTAQEIKDHFQPTNTMKQEKEIIGYNPRPEVNGDMACGLVDTPNKRSIAHPEFTFQVKSEIYNNAVKLGILDQLFEPVYKEERKTVFIRCEAGSFSVEVTKDNVISESIRIGRIELEDLINSACYKNVGGWESRFTHVDIESKKKIPVADIKSVYETLIGLNK